MTPRPYQEQAIQGLRDAIRAHDRAPGILVAPTGSGKSEIFGWMARSALSKGHRVGALVNRRILVNDLCKRVDRLGLPYGVIMADHPRKPWEPLQIASFDTLWRRPTLPKWDVVFVDECHFSLADNYSKVIARLREQGSAIIGMTATPIRGAGEGLGAIYKWMVRCPDTPDLIEAGYLVRPRVFAPPGQPDISRVKKTAGEFNQRELAQVCDNTKLTGDILNHWLKNGRGRPTIGFGVDIAHCKHMAEMFCFAGVRAFAVDHKYDGDFDLLWRRLANYELEIVFNVGIAGYGWDCPPVSMMIEARPTQSLGLWLQHCGRIMRKADGKTDAIINDHAGNALRHGLPDEPREWSLNGPPPREMSEKAPAVVTCKHSFRWPDGRVQLPCYATFARGPEACPFCGLPLQIKQRKIEHVAGELQEMKTRGMPLLHESDEKKLQREYYESLLEKAQEKGKNAGWAAFLYSKRFGEFPRKDWRTDWLSKRLNEEMTA